MNPHETIQEIGIMQPPEEEDYVDIPSNGQAEETSYEQEEDDVGEEEEPEGTESDAEDNVGDSSGEPIEPGKVLHL